MAAAAGRDLCHEDDDKNKSYTINFDVNKTTKDARRQYGKSKLAQIMYTNHLAKILEEENCNTIVAAVHPGFVRTELFSGVPTKEQPVWRALSYLLGKNTWQGAQTSIHVATGESSSPMSEVNGKFFADCRSSHWVARSMPKVATDPVACKQVWEETMALLGL